MAGKPRFSIQPPLAEVRRQLKAAGAEFPRAMQKELKAIAEEVAGAAKSKYDATYPRRSGDGSKSIRPRAGQAYSAVAIGGARAPYLPGQNFGSKQGPRKKQFPMVRRPDYFVYASVAERSEEINELAHDAIDRVMAEAFPDG